VRVLQCNKYLQQIFCATATHPATHPATLTATHPATRPATHSATHPATHTTTQRALEEAHNHTIINDAYVDFLQQKNKNKNKFI